MRNGTQLGIGAIDTSYGSPLMIYGAASTQQWITVQSGSSIVNFGIAGANGEFGNTVKAGDAVYKFLDGANMRIVTNSYELVHFSTVSSAPMIGFFNTMRLSSQRHMGHHLVSRPGPVLA